MIDGELVDGPFEVTWDETGSISSIRRIVEDESTKTIVGSIIAPGFIDIQVNGVQDVDVRNITHLSEWRTFDELLLLQGTTSYCPTVNKRFSVIQ